MLAILDRDYKHWSEVCHKKILKRCPDFIARCRDFTPSTQISIEKDLQYVAEAFHARLNTNNITARSRRRKKKKMVSTEGENLNEDLILSNNENFSDVFNENFNNNFNDNVLETGEQTINNEKSAEMIGTDSNTASEGEGPNSRIEGKFVSDNVINLSKKILIEVQVKVLSKGLKFCPTPKEIDMAKIKEDLENFGRRLRLKWFFRNEEEGFSTNPFKKKSNFNPKQDVVIEQQIMDIQEAGNNYSNLSKEEQDALKSLQNDTEIIIKSADKGSGVVVWDKEDYLKEAASQLSDDNVYEKIDFDPSSALTDRISECINRIRDRHEMDPDTLEFFEVHNPKLGRFYLLPKIHKRLKNVPGRPVISNSGYFTENISAFLDFHLQPLAKMVKSYIKDTNDFLKKLRDLPDLPQDSILCTIDVVGLYPNIPHEVGLEALRKSLDSRVDPEVSTATLMELAELVLKNNYFTHNEEVYHQKKCYSDWY